MPPIYRKFIRETAGRPAPYVPAVYSRNLSDTILTPDALTAAMQIYPRIKIKSLDDLISKLADESIKSISPLSQVKFPILFPRMNSGTQSYTVTWANDGFKNLDGVLLGGAFENVPSNRESVVAALQAGNGYGVTCRVAQYMICDYYTTNNNYSMSTGNAPVWNAYLAANNLYLYMAGTSGTMARNFFRSDFSQVNLSDYASVPTVGGRKVEDEFARQALLNFKTGAGAGVSPSLGVFFHDNIMNYCGGGTNVPGSADWDRDGAAENTNASDVSLKYRQGLKRYVDYLRANAPGLKLMANLAAVAPDASNQRPYDVGPSAMSPLYGIWDGCMYEGAYGDPTWVTISWAGHTATIKSLQYYEDFCIDPTLTMVGHIGMLSNGTDTKHTSLGQALRWSLSAVLVFTNMGYCWTGSSGNRSDGISPKLDFYGEFSAHPTTGVCATAWSNAAQNRKWMGTARNPRVAYNASAWQNGCYRRIFNGQAGKAVHVYHNPTTSPQTLISDTNLRRLTGGSDPAVNDGRAQNIGSTFTIPSQDGIWMLEQ